MKAQRKDKLPQEGTTGSGESLTGQTGSPTYSEGGNSCSSFVKPNTNDSGPSMDLSSLAEAITTTVDTSVVSQWTVAARKRPEKKGPRNIAGAPFKGKLRGPERSRPNRRARRETPQLKKPKHTVTADAAAETQREPVPTTSAKSEMAQTAIKSPTPPPPTSNQSERRRKPRGTRGRRIAATAPTAPEKEQKGPGGGPDERASSKRARLDDTQSPRGEAKRAKTDTRSKRTVSYADASQSHLRVAVITVPPRDLSQNQAEQLRETIDDSILQAVLSPPHQTAQAPSFRGRPFLLDGALAMWCENANALNWLEEAVKNMTSPIPGTTLAVIKQSEMKKKLKAGLLIHTRFSEAAMLQKVLCAQNPWYKVDSWQCYDMTVDENQQDANSKEKVVHLILGIPEDQKQTILDRDRRIAHMSGSGYIRFFSPEEESAAETKPELAKINTAKASSPEPSTSAPKPVSKMEEFSPLLAGESTSDEDDVLRSP